MALISAGRYDQIKRLNEPCFKNAEQQSEALFRYHDTGFNELARGDPVLSGFPALLVIQYCTG